MFKFLKDKLKGAISEITSKVEEEGKEEVIEQPVEEPTEEISEPLTEVPVVKEPVVAEKGFFASIKDRIVGEEPEIDKLKEEEFEEVKPEILEKEAKEEKKQEVKDVEIKKAEERIKQKLEKKKVPTIQELAERERPKAEIKQAPRVAPVERPVISKPIEVSKPEPEEESKPIVEKTGFFGKLTEKITTKTITEKQFDDLFWNLEIVLLENNVAVEVIEKIKQDLKQILVDKPLKRGAIEKTILDSLKNTLSGLFQVDKIDLLEKSKEKKPLVICFIGINGSGKTTTIAKVCNMLQENGKTCVLAAADTFRAAAIDQLQQHADNLGVRLIKHDYGADAAAVAFDAVKHAEAKGVDVVLIDTAGRIHSNIGLMDEMKKIIRVANPDLKIFIGESITGNDCTEQAKKFNQAVGIDGIILSKADIDEKGGAAISISYITGKPILYLGMGQEYKDLKEFDPNLIMQNLGF